MKIFPADIVKSIFVGDKKVVYCLRNILISEICFILTGMVDIVPEI